MADASMANFLEPDFWPVSAICLTSGSSRLVTGQQTLVNQAGSAPRRDVKG